MLVESGNLAELQTGDTGWVVGFGDHFDPALDLIRFIDHDHPCSGVSVKWMCHPAGDLRGLEKPISEGRTFSVMVSEAGHFVTEISTGPDFARDSTTNVVLRRHGDFVAYGPGLFHRWSVIEACTLITVRWTPL